MICAVVAATLDPEILYWFLWGGIGLLGAWVVLRLVLTLTGLLVRLLWMAGIVLLLLWAATHFLT